MRRSFVCQQMMRHTQSVIALFLRQLVSFPRWFLCAQSMRRTFLAIRVYCLFDCFSAVAQGFVATPREQRVRVRPMPLSRQDWTWSGSGDARWPSKVPHRSINSTWEFPQLALVPLAAPPLAEGSLGRLSSRTNGKIFNKRVNELRLQSATSMGDFLE